MHKATINTQELKLMIIDNFIDYLSSDDNERESMRMVARDYVNQDHVDEIGQAMGCENEPHLSPYSVIDSDVVSWLSIFEAK